MTIRSTQSRPWLKWLPGFCLWTVIGLSFAFQFYISSSNAGNGVSWAFAVSYSLADWYVFALLSIPVTRLARRFPFEKRQWRQSLAVHLPASMLFSLAYMVLRADIGSWQGHSTFSQAFQPLLVKTWHFNLMIYWVIVAVSSAIDYQRKFREREMKSLELERRLVQAKLQALQMQLNPHFLFNTLHSISSLMHQDVEAADRMITRLSDLLRAALKGGDRQQVALREELDLLRRYLEIEQIRFGDRLTVKIDAAADTLESQVPSLILQPLVENAIRHGIEPHAKPGRIEIHARREGDQLRITVADNGASPPPGATMREGVGLSNTRARMDTLYGSNQKMDLRRPSSGGFEVELTLPYRTGEATA